MMIRYASLALFFLLVTPASAQPLVIDEAVSGGGASADVGDAVALANDGSRYVVGTFEGTATFGEVSVTSAGDSDVFLVKYDAEGNALWARRGGTSVFNDFGAAAAVAPDGSVYAGGYFTGIATWDGGDNPDIELTTFSDFDAFVAKYTPDGDLEWVRQAGGVDQDTGRDLATDAEGNVYFTGSFTGTGTFGDVTLTSAGSSDAFLVKYDPDGEVVWARRGGSDQGDVAYGVAVTDDGRAHLSGSFRGVAIFGALPLQSAGETDIFVVQYDADGEPVWVEGIGADGSEFTRGGGVGIGEDGSVYVTGSFQNTILVGSDVLASTGFTDIFVAKLDADGEEVWGRRGGGDGTNFSAALAVDAGGNVLTTGYVDGTGTFADEPITTQGRDGYLAVFDADGGLVTVELLGGTGQDAGAGVVANNALGRFAATGQFRGTATFGDLELTSVGSSDVYVIGGPAGESVQSVIYVDADAIGANDGSSWTNAFTDLQDALTLAGTLDVGGLQIWVAEGTYYPTDDGDRTVSFELQSGLALYGGFDGKETALDQRDWEANETILSGDIGVPSELSDNSYHIVTSDAAESPVLDGFIVTLGNASGAPGFSGGGGLYCADSDLTVRNSRFTGNQAHFGGGTLLMVCDGLFFNVTYDENTARNIGPDNFAAGGGMWISGSSPLLVNTYFIRNRSESLQFASGGGLEVQDMSAPVIINSQFLGNLAGGSGACEGGAVENFMDTAPHFINVTFVGNQCTSSYLFNHASDISLTNVTAARNQAGINNSGFSSSPVSVRVENSILSQNGGPEIDDPFEVNVSVYYSIVEGGFDGTSIAVLNTNPQFTRNPSRGPDGEWGTEDDDYGDLRLQEGSPAIDFGRAEFLPPDTFDLDGDGDTTEPLPVDLDGEARVQGNEVDLGAYESPFAVALEPGTGVPTTNALGAAYPNPFHGRTTLALDLAEAQDVTVEVFDVLGRRVATVHDGPLEVGEHRVVIEAGGLPAGVYVVHAEGEAFRFTQRVTLVR